MIYWINQIIHTELRPFGDDAPYKSYLSILKTCSSFEPLRIPMFFHLMK